MPVTAPAKAPTPARRTQPAPRPNASTQARFATSKLIQNLGSNPEQFGFTGRLRNVHGRD